MEFAPRPKCRCSHTGRTAVGPRCSEKNQVMTDFKDHFSKQSDIYFKYRPSYPTELYVYLSSLTETHELAWDCGTGNGQAAVSLTQYFQQVYATDPSEQQINNAIPNPRIVYKVEKAESCSLPDHAADLITVAQALHWFDFDQFYAEVQRVLKPDGVFAAWTYSLPYISAEIDTVVQHFHDHILEGYWQYENSLVNQEYATIPFPFDELPSPDFKYEREGSLEDLLGLLRSWSGVQRYAHQNGVNPVKKIESTLMDVWGSPDKKRLFYWKIFLRAGKNCNKTSNSGSASQ